MKGVANTLSRNPNMCASCSSMADGMDDLNFGNDPEPSVNHETEAPRVDAPLNRIIERAKLG
jgi:hypothetical protein